MSPRALATLLLAWIAATLTLAATVHGRARIDPRPRPDATVTRWALGVAHAACKSLPLPEAPTSARRRTPDAVLVDAWRFGRRVARAEAHGSLDSAVREASLKLSREPSMRGVPCDDTTRFTVALVEGRGALVTSVPYLKAFSLVPLHDALSATLDGRTAWLTPSDLLASGAYDHGIPTPLPELVLGVDLDALSGALAFELNVSNDALRTRGTLSRWRVTELAEGSTSRPEPVTETSLREHARAGARFITRHQHPDGRFVYLYDGRTNGEAAGSYDLPRHAGTTLFLSLMSSLDGDDAARASARGAIAWLSARSVECGAPDRRCAVLAGNVADIGATALSASAVAEFLAGGDDPAARSLLAGFAAFMRAQQRPDGEFMHQYDLDQRRPIDVQFLYYSGETALALLRAYAVLHDRRDLEAAQRALSHLSGRSWSFFGSRYYYGEEHWTCIAAGEAREVSPSREALDFCLRWADWNRALQYGQGETPWDAAGTYGVGPVLVPMLTPTGSRTEAFIETWLLASRLGVAVPGLRAQIEAGLGALLRHQWTPGPTHLFADPAGAEGGFPMGAASLSARNDYVQHSGAAMIRWADVLRREREARR